MDPSILQAAQRVMAWHLQHLAAPSDASAIDRANDDSEAPEAEDLPTRLEALPAPETRAS